jgi:hypothetical protein
MSNIDTVAEAIRDAQNEVVFGESNEEAWRRLAQAAIDALGLTQECGVSFGNKPPDRALEPNQRFSDFGPLWHRWTRPVGPWTEVTP